MTIQDVIKKIEGYHPDLGPSYNGCDGIKCGNPDVECTGIVTALVPTVDVIKKTAELGYNMLYVHEPTSYLTPDYPVWKADFKCDVYDEKIKLATDNGIVIYRDHDHTHAHRPDGIFTGVLKYMGWLDYLNEECEGVPFGFVVDLPEAQSVEELNRQFMEKIGMNGVRYIGRAEDKIKRLAIVAHLFPNAFVETVDTEDHYDDFSTQVIKAMQRDDIDAIVPGEIIEWNLLSYIRDASQLGENKVCFNLGHFNWEELGAKYAADWIPELVGNELPVRYVKTDDMWNYAV